MLRPRASLDLRAMALPRMFTVTDSDRATGRAKPIDEDAGTDFGAFLDMCLEARVPWQRARVVMVEIPDRDARIEQADEIVAVRVE